MKSKSFWIACVVIYLVGWGLNYLVHDMWLLDTYNALRDVLRPADEIKRGIFPITAAIWTILFVYIFSRGYEGKGVMEGVRFGAIIGVFYALPMAYDSYAIYPIPYSLALKWFLSGMVINIIYGVVASLLYKPENTSAA